MTIPHAHDFPGIVLFLSFPSSRGSLYLTPHTARPYLAPRWLQRVSVISARTVAHSTCTPRGTQVYAHDYRHRYERSRDGRIHDAVFAATTTGNSTEEVYAPSEGCTRRRRSRRRRWRRRRRTISRGERSYRFWPCRASGQIFPTPLTALIALHFNPDVTIARGSTSERLMTMAD